MDTTTRPRTLALFLSVALACVAAPAAAEGAVRAPASAAQPASLDDPRSLEALQPGDYLWEPQRAQRGPVVMVVSLPEQRMHVYRDGVRIGVTTISSGKAGKETPTGSFEILQKKREHYSNLYNNAPMPFMQRLTWDGIALHAGALPGYPASNGCIRLPKAFAETLFEYTERGGRVVVADLGSHGLAVVHPGDRSPVDAYTGLEFGVAEAAYATGAAYGATPD